MKAVIIKAPGATNQLKWEDVAPPRPGPGEVRVEVAYCGCNFADTMMFSGTYPHPKGYPLIAGLELSGRIDAVGPGVTAYRPGDRVAAFSEDAGAFAERCVVPAERLILIPDAMTLDVAAAFPIQALTAWHLVHNVSATRPGDVILLHAIGGGLGLLATQIAVKAGATVIGTVGTRGKEKRALAMGAALVINRDDEDFVAAVLNFTAGRGVDTIIDSTGDDILDRSFSCIRKLGHVVSYGEAAGRPLANLWERLVSKSLTFTRLHLGHVDFSGEVWKTSVNEVVGDILAGRLIVRIEQVFAFEQAGAMLDRLASRAVSGKLLLAVAPGLT